MNNIVLIDFTQADGFDKIFIQDSRIDKGVEEILEFFSVVQGGIHTVGLFLKSGHFILYWLEVRFKIK